MRYFKFLLIVWVLLQACTPSDIHLKTESLTMTIDPAGYVKGFSDPAGENYALNPRDSMQPVLQLWTDKGISYPVSAAFQENILTLEFNEHTASVQVDQKQGYLRFELMDIVPDSNVNVAVWGPYNTSIDSLIGETVGVVRGGSYALGIQSLNPRTLGGYPWKENDAMPQMDIFESGDYSDLSEEGKRYVLYRVEAAKPIQGGSSLQAYVRKRDENRVISNMGHDNYLAPPYEDGGLKGSAIAIFGCAVERSLDYIEMVELGEGLPHPTLGGEWTKRSRAASSAYLIMGFDEGNFRECLDYTLQAGLKYLYHPGPFETWGHFRLNPSSFPEGRKTLREMVDMAEEQGISIGVHTLSNFITPNDPYVSPVPDERLASVGPATLIADLTAGSKNIIIDTDKYLVNLDEQGDKVPANLTMRTVRIGEELIRFGSVESEGSVILLDCERGAFGTSAQPHKAGDSVYVLADHAYKVFLSNTELTREISKNLAELYNETGLRQISFDGLEGNRSTGMGNYGETLMPLTWYEGLDEDIRSGYIADASRTTHFFWHIFTRMNWGEPWYAGFRESQTEYRLKNQAYFQRNMIPGMLGWFLLRPTTSVEDIEWMLAKSAAFDAGYAFVCNLEALGTNGQTDEILGLISNYEQLRMNGSFSPEQKLAMSDPGREFHLEHRSEDDWTLYSYHLERATHSARPRQPGEPGGSPVGFFNPYQEQELQFLVTAPGNSDVSELRVEIDNGLEISLGDLLPAGHILKYTGGSRAFIFDENWNRVGMVRVDPSQLMLGKGDHIIRWYGEMPGDNEAELKLELKVKEQI